MLIMKSEATHKEIEQVVRQTTRYGLKADISKGVGWAVINLWVTRVECLFPISQVFPE